MNSIQRHVAGLVELAGDAGCIGGHLLLHCLYGEKSLVIVAAGILQPVPGVSLVGGDYSRRIFIDDFHARLLKRGFEVAKNLDFTHALARSVIPGVKFTFQSFLRYVTICIFCNWDLHLLELFVFTTMNRATRHAGDERRIFAALGILRSIVLSNQERRDRNQYQYKESAKKPSHGKPQS